LCQRDEVKIHEGIPPILSCPQHTEKKRKKGYYEKEKKKKKIIVETLAVLTADWPAQVLSPLLLNTRSHVLMKHVLPLPGN
jgi:hypothetical protein